MSVALAPDQADSLPALVRRAAAQLASATDAAEVLEARDAARIAWDAAKSAARIARAKAAHDDVIAAVYRAQADALVIEAAAKRRLADEYDAAQERGEVAGVGKRVIIPSGNNKPTVEDLGITSKDIHEARLIRDAEVADPGIVERSLYERLEAGHEPTRTALREAVSEAAMRGLRPAPVPTRRNPDYRPNPQRDVALAVADACRVIGEAVERFAPDYILSGFADRAERERGIAKMKAAFHAIQNLLGAGLAE